MRSRRSFGSSDQSASAMDDDAADSLLGFYFRNDKIANRNDEPKKKSIQRVHDGAGVDDDGEDDREVFGRLKVKSIGRLFFLKQFFFRKMWGISDTNYSILPILNYKQKSTFHIH
jgi:hypothetical protein